ncbi:Endonuclease/exonuclease/phosphatase [Staphylotrichum tortipilum]|uniref:Endonuclease/exonuclease/phosphatase n=1 Tax=Staphylotrichum tortipilum TaxID=2831512 RepID=A0AAN6MTY6_9PEZI|nr:Endonuclease/exonuclease/phosphatase [Staphylotrichum longicolle]
MTTTTISRSLPIRLVTLNIRYATKNPSPGEEPWSVRCPRLCAQLNFITAGCGLAFICLQEVLHSQLTDLQARLGPAWGHIGRGREDGKQAGEYSPIFFRADRWECERSRTCWLSPTPDVPSKGWDAALERVVTLGSFRHWESGTSVVVMSTHFDHRGEVAREQSARLLLELARTWPEHDTAAETSPLPPVFIGGDFNSTPTGRAYQVLTEPGSGVRDISDLVPDEAKYGNREITYTSFGEPGEQPARIDFLFARDTERLCVLNLGILANRFDDGVYLSDHRPVVADVEIPVSAAT